MSFTRKALILCLAAVLLLTSACGAGTGKPAAQSETPAAAEKNGDVVVLFTGDVHCGIDDGFGYTGAIGATVEPLRVLAS